MSRLPISALSIRLWKNLCDRFGRSGVVLLAAMVLLLIGSATFALRAETPWGRTVQKRLEKQQPLQPKEYAVIGLWWAAVVNTGVLATLLGCAGYWMPKPNTDGSSSDADATGAASKPQRWMVLLLIAAVGFAAWERWPRLSHSYWNDEAYMMHRFAHGAWEEGGDGRLTFEPVTWTNTLFENRNGNNHLLNSLFTRCTLDAWRAFTGAPRESFDETVTRFVPMLAGLGSLALVFALGCQVGSPLSGVAAAWLLAMHPWHIRYSVELRGYALLLFFLTLALWALCRAWQTDRLRWWVLFALSEGLFLLSFAGALYVALVLNVLLSIELLARWDLARLRRLIAFNSLAAVPVLQWMLPSIPQLLQFLKETHTHYVIDRGLWFRDLGSVLAVGWPYESTYPEAHVGTDWKHVVGHFLTPPWGTVALLGGLMLAGVAYASWRNRQARLIVLAPLLGALVTIAMSLKPGSVMIVWYLI
ncbi:MAG: glycosyltransferase family 39 protein, partial [Roseimicrobium sp.]